MELRSDLSKPFKNALNHDGRVQIIDIAFWCCFGCRCFQGAKSEAIAVAVDGIEFELEFVNEAFLFAFLVPERKT